MGRGNRIGKCLVCWFLVNTEAHKQHLLFEESYHNHKDHFDRMNPGPEAVRYYLPMENHSCHDNHVHYLLGHISEERPVIADPTRGNRRSAEFE